MIRRYFLRFLALSPLAGLVAVRPARADLPVDAPDYPGRTVLASRMLKIWLLRKKYDELTKQWHDIEEEVAGWWLLDHPRYQEYNRKVTPILTESVKTSERIRELERRPLPMEALLGDPEFLPNGAFYEFTRHHKDCGYHCDQYPWECDCGVIKQGVFTDGHHLETRRFRRDELAPFSAVYMAPK